ASSATMPESWRSNSRTYSPARLSTPSRTGSRGSADTTVQVARTRAKAVAARGIWIVSGFKVQCSRFLAPPVKSTFRGGYESVLVCGGRDRRGGCRLVDGRRAVFVGDGDGRDAVSREPVGGAASEGGVSLRGGRADALAFHSDRDVPAERPDGQGN